MVWKKKRTTKLKVRTEAKVTYEASACGRVFAIVELAEAIFLLLPMYDILVNIQRTSKRWNATVASSSPLQESLFFKSATRRTLFHKPNFEGEFTLQHVLLNPFANLYRPARIWVYEDMYASLGILRRRPRNWNAAMLRSDASWRRQLLTQPPIHSFELSAKWFPRKTITAHPSAEGITLQDFIDACGCYLSWNDYRGSVDRGPPADEGGLAYQDGGVSIMVKASPVNLPNFEELQEVKNLKYTGCWGFKE